MSTQECDNILAGLADALSRGSIAEAEPPPAEPRARVAPQDTEWDAILLATIIGMCRTPDFGVAAARTAIRDYGSLSAVFGAPSYELSARADIGPAGATNISRAKKVLTQDACQEFQTKTIIGSFDKLIRYLDFQSGHLMHEEVRLLCLGSKKELLQDVRLSSGTSTKVCIDVFTIMTAALRANARSFVIVHNHPSGDPEPSDEDRIMTSNIADACRPVDIYFFDHLIVARSRWFSFRQAGLL